jgi:hypothetical protein
MAAARDFVSRGRSSPRPSTSQKVVLLDETWTLHPKSLLDVGGFLRNLLAWNVDYLSECQVTTSTFGTSDLDLIRFTKWLSFSPKSGRLNKSAAIKHCCIFFLCIFWSLNLILQHHRNNNLHNMNFTLSSFPF